MVISSCLCYIPGIVNPADALTKALGTTLHYRHVRRLMGHYGAPWMPLVTAGD
jgi:hypothetical protein